MLSLPKSFLSGKDGYPKTKIDCLARSAPPCSLIALFYEDSQVSCLWGRAEGPRRDFPGARTTHEKLKIKFGLSGDLPAAINWDACDKAR